MEIRLCISDLKIFLRVLISRKIVQKPWGTGQAVLSCEGKLHEPFVVINADDYYGKEAFVKIHEFL